jgi:hypothetical protein
MMKVMIVAGLSMLLGAVCVQASEENVVIGDIEMPAIDSSMAFKQVEKKVGKWEGKMTQGLTGAVIDVSYEWRMTSGGNTITETLVEDGVEMLTTYSDKNGELVVQHYCALGTEPIFRVSSVSESELSLALDESASDLHAEHESFVTSMQWDNGRGQRRLDVVHKHHYARWPDDRKHCVTDQSRVTTSALDQH